LKFEKMHIKYKLFFYLIIFTAVILVLLWLFQTVFLDSFYRAIKTQSVKTSAQEIADNINLPDLQSYINALAQKNDITVRVLDAQDNEIVSENMGANSIIYRLPADVIGKYKDEAKANGGTILKLFPDDSDGMGPNQNALDQARQEEQAGQGNQAQQQTPGQGNRQLNNMIKNMIYVQLVEKTDGSSMMVVVGAMISPVNATVETLRIQLMYISAAFVVLSLILAFIISAKISKPIVKINSSAKELARGNYDTKFDGKGYREISELNETLNYAAKELSKVEALRRELIANVSHDLRTPLTMITGYSEVMRDLPRENTPENVQIVIDEAKRLTTLVNDLLDLSKFQSGAQELRPARYNLTHSVRGILKRYDKLTRQDGYNITFLADEDVYVCADEAKITQVVYNLINNAITYTGEDKSVAVRQTVHDGKVRIGITDTGEGIPEDQLDYIWDRYYKIDRVHKRAAVGTGLGLSIVKAILEKHRAEYSVISKEGQGSTFWFELAICD